MLSKVQPPAMKEPMLWKKACRWKVWKGSLQFSTLLYTKYNANQTKSKAKIKVIKLLLTLIAIALIRAPFVCNLSMYKYTLSIDRVWHPIMTAAGRIDILSFIFRSSFQPNLLAVFEEDESIEIELKWPTIRWMIFSDLFL